MRLFLMRLFGSPKHAGGAEEERFKKNLKKLDKRGEELDKLGDQLEDIQESSRKNQTTLNNTCTEFTALSKSVIPLPRSEEESSEDVEKERISGDPVPSEAPG